MVHFLSLARELYAVQEEVPMDRVILPSRTSFTDIEQAKKVLRMTSISASSTFSIVRLYPLDIYVLEDLSGMDGLNFKAMLYLAEQEISDTLESGDTELPSILCNVRTVDYGEVLELIQTSPIDKRFFFVDLDGIQVSDFDLSAGDYLVNHFREWLEDDDDDDEDEGVDYFTALQDTIPFRIFGEAPKVDEGMGESQVYIAPKTPEEIFTELRRTDIAHKHMSGDDNLEIALKAYIQGAGKTDRVFTLIGTTAVAKSALVKDVAEDLGYRLVDIRCAFMDRLDLEGIHKADAENFDESDGLFSHHCPHEKIVQCSDAYLEYSRNAQKKLEEYVTTLNITDDNGVPITTQAQWDAHKKSHPEVLADSKYLGLAKALRLLKNIRETSKPAVLFFDEINRALPVVRSAMVQLLTSKKLENLEFRESKIVCAANTGAGAGDGRGDDFIKEVLDDAFAGTTHDPSRDIAGADRFEPHVVSPQSRFPSWIRWAEGSDGDRQNIHPVIIDFIREKPSAAEEMAYSAKYSVGVHIEVYDEDRPLAEIPFPNYRTWEYVSNHMYGVQESIEAWDPNGAESSAPSQINRDIIAGLIGDETVTGWTESPTTIFMNYLTNPARNSYHDAFYPKKKKLPRANVREGVRETDKMSIAMADALDSGIPFFMQGTTSIGKSRKVKEYAERVGAELVVVNLASKDRVSVVGGPFARKTATSLTKGLSLTELPDGVQAAIMDVPIELPSETTMFAQDAELTRLLEKIIADPKGLLILFFDEVNRAQPEVSSAVFEAISDNRFMGVTFPKKKLRVILAGNVGGDSIKLSSGEEKETAGYGEVEAMDPAYAARCCIYRKEGFDADDLIDIWEYISEAEVDSTGKQVEDSARPYHPAVVSWFKDEMDKNPNGLLDILNDTSGRKFDESIPSLRAFADMSRELLEGDTPFLTGASISESLTAGIEQTIIELAQAKRSPVLDAKTMLAQVEACERVINSLPSNWAPLMMGKQLFADEDKDGQGITVKDYMEGTKKFIADVRADLEAGNFSEKDAKQSIRELSRELTKVNQLNQVVVQFRREFVEAKVGHSPLADVLTSHLNTEIGHTIIELADCTDESLFTQFLNQEIGGGLSYGQKSVGFVEVVNKLQHLNPVPERGFAFFKAASAFFADSSTFQQVMVKCSESPRFIEMVKNICESRVVGRKFDEWLMAAAQISDMALTQGRQKAYDEYYGK